MSYEFVEYREEFGPVNWQEGFEKELEGRTIEEQISCYVLSKTKARDCTYQDFADLSKNGNDWIRKELSPVNFKKVILRDGLVVGFVIDKWTHEENLAPYDSYVYDYSCDNNGSGYKETYWYKYLLCVPFEHEAFW